MVADVVWAASGLGPDDGVLCLDCFERRLGRRLRYREFKPTNPETREFWHGADRMLPRAWWPK